MRILVRCSLGLDALVDFFAVHGNIFRGIDSQAYLKTLNAKNRDGDLVTNVYAFAYFAGEYQHNLFLDGLLKCLYQEAGVCLYVVIVADCIQMRPSV